MMYRNDSEKKYFSMFREIKFMRLDGVYFVSNIPNVPSANAALFKMREKIFFLPSFENKHFLSLNKKEKISGIDSNRK